MKKYAILSIAVIIAICGIGIRIYKNLYKDAEIVFSYQFIMDGLSDKNENIYLVYFIDNKGCIYKTEDKNFFYTRMEQYLEANPNYAKDKKFIFLGQIEEDEWQEKIKCMREIAMINTDIEVRESMTCDVKGQKKWYGYYRKNNKLEAVILHGEGDTSYINKNSKADELVQWLNGVFGISSDNFK